MSIYKVYIKIDSSYKLYYMGTNLKSINLYNPYDKFDVYVCKFNLIDGGLNFGFESESDLIDRYFIFKGSFDKFKEFLKLHY